ncbi:hypothetical protein TrCOL_g9071 [Triparma columacea]|uniref:Uncharacterized protein n=1 Tax=Triparma columacea TaxID=722753 RepID=A0A9W7GFT6_9STRA|nr:hypothetical protein TrCOL_g9071 [Triparma columacea]
MMSGRDAGWAGQVGLSARSTGRGNRARVGLEPARGPAAPTASNNRRRSLDHLMANSVHERMQSTAQLRVVKSKSGAARLIEEGEIVPKGCLSRATGDYLVEIALGEEESEVGTLKVAQCFLAILLVPPMLSSLIWGFYPFASPDHGIIGSHFLPGFALLACLSVPGIGLLLCVAVSVPPTTRGVLKFTAVYAGTFIAGYWILGESWRFPIPFGLLIVTVIAAPSACLALFHDIFGRTFFTKQVLFPLLPLIGVGLLPAVFMVGFCFYRSAFMQMTTGQQAAFGPVWPIMKLGLKQLAAKLVEMGKNPDASPFMLMTFDAVAGMCGNFLFISATDVSSVFAMISVDIMENIFIALRVVGIVQSSLKDSVIRIQTQKDIEIADLRHRLDRHDERLDWDNAQKTKLLEGLHTQYEQINERLKRLEEGRQLPAFDERLELEEGSELPEMAEGISKMKGGRFLQQDEPPTMSSPLLRTRRERTMDPTSLEAIGAENLHLHRAVRLLLSYLASELSEMVSSAWMMMMLPILYWCPNKEYLYTIVDLDDEGFHRALRFSAIDFGLEMLTFCAMLVVFMILTNVNVYGVGVMYFQRMNLFVPALLLGIGVSILPVAFLLKHLGMDPLMRWDLEASNNATAVGNSTTLE